MKELNLNTFLLFIKELDKTSCAKTNVFGQKSLNLFKIFVRIFLILIRCSCMCEQKYIFCRHAKWLILAGVLASPASFAQQLKLIDFAIERGQAVTSFLQFAEQADVTFAVKANELQGITTNPVQGQYTAEQALTLLLSNTGLTAEIDDSGRLILNSNKQPRETTTMNKTKIYSGVIAALMGVSATQANAQEQTEAQDSTEVIQVKGFRSSLNKSLLTKRASVNALESISAEDIGKFPDQNIAESLQRVPGVAISREGGEGRRITLRGLGPDFTRTTLNGMEIPAITDELDSSVSALNGGRAFEFNMFASELFNRVDIQKSPTAAIEEGGIAGTVDLYSAKPFDNRGFHAAASLQGNYSELSDSVDPRVALLVSNTFADDTFGALLSVAFSTRNVNQEGFGTVGWQTPVVNGMTYIDSPDLVVNGTPANNDCQLNGQSVNAINCLYTPRLPRPDFFGNEQERIGITTALQWAPTDDIEITFDYLHSELENDRAFYNFYEMYRNYFDQLTALEVTVHENGKQVEAGLYDGLTGRIESRQTYAKSDFDQYSLSGEFHLTDRLQVNAMLGLAEANLRREEFRHIMDTLDTHKFAFDFSKNANAPEVTYFYDFNDPSQYNLSSFDGAGETEKRNLTGKLDLIYAADEVTIKTGLAYNDRSIDVSFYNIPALSLDSAEGFTEDFPEADFGEGFDGYTFPFIVADFDKVNQKISETTGKDGWNLLPANGYEIVEETLAAYIDLTSQFEVAGMLLDANFGVRMVDTSTTSTGYVEVDGKVLPIEVEHDYSNFLPAMNLALEAMDDLIVRLGITRSMTRPSLTKLSPGKPTFRYIEGFATVGNPKLNPYVSNNFDLALEWYFDEEALFGATLFYKDIETYIRSTQEDKLIDPVYYPAIEADPNFDPRISVDPYTKAYTHFSSGNGKGTDINGIELIYQQPLNFLPGLLSNTGIVANYTKVHSGELVGVSENSYNFTFYYEEEDFGGRISVNSRDDYFLEVPGFTGNAQSAATGPTHVDFSSFYNITENMTVSFEIINLTDEYSRLYMTGDGSMNLMREYNHTGRQFSLGLRFNM
ncbi:TonB-dependent receptor [Catenovulum sp. SX2]|uniref:TonB-dependent receptor n=1 Tax=Catenovulum sp. SX2 TaxID=3398614 RepID=UPI003F837313